MISGRAFAEHCYWVHDPRYPEMREFYPQFAKDGDWVFVNGDYLSTLLRKFTPLNSKRFHFIVHNSDRSFGETEFYMLSPRSYHIYAINTTFVHPQLTTIPIGFPDKVLDRLRTYVPEDIPRTIEVYGNFKICNNVRKRTECKLSVPTALWKDETDFNSYLHDLCSSKFVLCPEGAGIDTHRVYEALLCGSTPVVLHSSLDSLYRQLPVCIVNSWTDTYYVPEGKPQFDIAYFLRAKQ